MDHPKLIAPQLDPVEQALEEVAELASLWFERHLAGKPVSILGRALVMACQNVSALELAKHAAFRKPATEEDPDAIL